MNYSREELIAFFADGKIPTGAQFEALINSIVSRYDDGIEKSAATATRLSAGADTFAPVLGLCPNGSQDAAWLMSMNAGGQDGLNIAPGSAKEAPFFFLQRLDGKLGLGTQSPQAELELRKNQDAATTIAIKNAQAGGQASSKVELWSDSGKASISKHNANQALEIHNQSGNLIFKGASANGNLHIDGANGNVGIGKANPSLTLDVAGPISTNGAEYLLGTGTEDASHLGSTGLFWTGPDSTQKTKYGIYRTAGAWTSSAYQQLRLQFNTGIQLGAGTGPNTGYDKSYVEILSGKGLMLTSGKLGIGTISPNGAIDIAAGGILMNSGLSPDAARPAIASTRISSELGSYGGNGLASNEGLLRLSAGGGTNKFSKSFIDLSGNSSNADLHQNISLGTSGLERMRIDSEGKIGIGTNAPKVPIDFHSGGIGLKSDNLSNTSRPAISSLPLWGEIWAYSHYDTLANDKGFLRLSAGGGQTVGAKSCIDISGFHASEEMNNTITFSTAGQERARLTRLGRLGLGNTNPNNTLDIGNGGISLKSSLSNVSTRPAVTASPISAEIIGQSVNGITADDGFLRLAAGGGTNANTKSFIDLSAYSTVPDMDRTISIGTSGAERIRIDANGNIGFGTNAPKIPIDFHSGGIGLKSDDGGLNARPALSKLPIWGEIWAYSPYDNLSNDRGMLRLSAGGAGSVSTKAAIDISGYHPAEDMNSTITFMTSGTERARISRFGKFGIGNNNPSNTLDIGTGGISLRSDLNNMSGRPAITPAPISAEIIGQSNNGTAWDDGFLRLSAGGGTNISTKSFIDLTGYSQVEDMARTIVFGTSGAERMRIDASGRVGIGNNNPQFPLQVNGVGQWLNPSFRYYAYSSTAGGLVGASSGSTIRVSIAAESRIIATEFNAFSDARIKTNVQNSEPESDLEKLMKARVVDYDYKDQIEKGEGRQKGFIAQEIEKIVPEAVSTSTEYVPNIFARSLRLKAEKGQLLVSMEAPHNLESGELLRWMDSKGQYDATCEVLDETTFRVPLEGEAPEEIFVYGKQVSDYRTIDYNKMFCINFSVTQGLVTSLEALKAENDALKKEIQAIHALLKNAGQSGQA